MTRILDNHSVHAFPLKGSQLIEASAGTGKTYTIANLYLRHILAGRDVRELLVVTFTEAATEELRGRIRARLYQAARLLQTDGDAGDDEFLQYLQQQVAGASADDGENGKALERLQLALHGMDEAAIFTIHGFCKRMLTEFAFNSGQGFRFELSGDDADLHREVLRDWWRTVFYADTERGLLALIGTQLKDVESFYQHLKPWLGVAPPALLPAAVGLDSLRAKWADIDAALTGIVAEWRQRGDELKQRLLDCKTFRANLNLFKKRDEYLANIDLYLRDRGCVPPDASFEMVRQSRLLSAQRKDKDPALNDAFFERCDALWEQLQTLGGQILPWALVDAAAMVNSSSATVKQHSREFSYDDLLRHLHAALLGSADDVDAAAAGPVNPVLAKAIRERYPVAMIDEFQDTDSVQYAIFHAIYAGQPDCAWTMIGDPKQAIYSFRGGDIFTYARAKADVGEQGMYTLDTNWRSVPAVVSAANRLFGCRDDAFIYADAIPFEPTRPADKPHQPLLENGVEGAGLTLWHWIEEGQGKQQGKPKGIAKKTAIPAINHAVCAEITRLIEGGRDGSVLIGDQPLRPADIAVLVRTHHEADTLRDALREWGVAAVTVGEQKVFATDEAAALLTLLRAVAAPTDRRAAAAALACPLLGLDYAGVHAVISDDQRWGRWCADLVALHRLWLQHGFMAQFQALLQRLAIPASLSRQSRAERRITNLLQLGELCQQAARQHPGMDGLLHWVAAQTERPEGEQQELRLESDDELVQLVTIHKSKGLEYPVVLLPYLWACRPVDANAGVGFHRDGSSLRDVGSDQLAAHLCLAEKERLAEDLRLLYVAVTRARSRCYLLWGSLGSKGKGAGDYTQSALGYLLTAAQKPQALDTTRPNALQGSISAAALQQCVLALDGDGIAVTALPDPEQTPLRVLAASGTDTQFVRRQVGREVVSDWRVESFSSLTRDGDTVSLAHSVSRATPEADPALRFARGSQVGSFLHGLLEELDFQQPAEPQLRASMDELARQFGLDVSPAQRADLMQWLPRVLQTPLDAQGLRLSDIGNAQRLNELEFDFSTAQVDIAALDAMLAQRAGRELPGIGAHAFRGIVNGIIDLVFEHQGRYYLADYKSNYLGPSFDDYAAGQLGDAMLAHRYDLQSMLYTLALHRYLRSRIRGYDYQRHFGGAFYLFMRGMRPESGADCGVYFERLEPALLQKLDEQLFAHGGEHQDD